MTDEAKELERLRDMARRAQWVLIDYPEGGPPSIQIEALTKALVALSSTILKGPDDDQEPIRWLRAVDIDHDTDGRPVLTEAEEEAAKAKLDEWMKERGKRKGR